MVGRALVVAGALALAGAACRHPSKPPAASHLRITITDGPGGAPLWGRVVLWQGDQPVRFGRAELYGGVRQIAGACRLGGDALATFAGLIVPAAGATVPVGPGDPCRLAPGRYRVWAWRGFEYDRWEGEVTVGAGEVALAIPLHRAFAVAGALAADLHVHGSGSNDSGLADRERVAAQLASGLQVTALTDHAASGSLAAAIEQMGVGDRIAAIAGDEAGNDAVHLGVYPMPAGPSPSAAEMAKQTPAELMAWAHGLATHPIVQVNHPRFRMYALFDVARWDGASWPPAFPLAFDAVEVLNGHNAFDVPGDLRIDEVVRDYHALAAHGVRAAAIGASDTHHLNGVLDGVARTYVRVADPRTRPFDQDGFVAAIRGGRTVATTGPWLDVRISDTAGGAAVGPGQAIHPAGATVHVEVDLAQASWVHADEVRVTAGGEVVAREAIPAGAATHHLALDVAVRAPSWIAVEASGRQPLPVEQTGTYQVEKGRPGVTPFAIATPIWIE